MNPTEFARIAQFPGLDRAHIPWDLIAPKKPSISITGSNISVRVRSTALNATGKSIGGSATVVPVEMRAVFVDSHSRQQEAELGDLPVAGSAEHTLSTPIPCRDGCLLTGFDFFAPGAHAPLTGKVTIHGLSVSGHPIALGKAHTWRNTTAAEDGSTTASGAPGGGLGVTFRQSGASDVTLTSTAVPTEFPALVSGAMPAGSHGNDFRGLGLDGLSQHMTRAASLPFVPGSPPDSSLVNIASLQRLGVMPISTDQVQVWYASNDPAVIGRVAAELKKDGISTDSTTTTRAALHRYTRTATTWALQLGVVVGAVAAVIAALTLVIAVTTTWRVRSRDYAALRMTGLSPRRLALMSIGEQLPVIMMSVILGIVCGVAGARVAMPKVPLFDSPPDIPVTDYGAAWPAVALTGAGALFVLGIVGWISGRWVARRATLTRLRDSL